MATEEELLEQKRAVEERKLGLEKYQAEIRRIQVEIVCLTYRRNSGIWSCIEHDETIRNLKKELKSQITALKRDYGITDRLIPPQIAEYDIEIFRIRRQLAQSVPDSPSGDLEKRFFPETASPLPSQLRERSRGGGRDR